MAYGNGQLAIRLLDSVWLDWSARLLAHPVVLCSLERKESAETGCQTKPPVLGREQTRRRAMRSLVLKPEFGEASY